MDDSYSGINDDTRENGIYFLPDRWVIKPELVQLALDNGLFCSPFNISSSAGASEKHVLHVGCGDGTWASRVALEYPKWMVMGIDDRLTITHKRHRSPLRPNVRFLRDPEVSLLDMLRRFPNNSYDLVHCRFLILSLSSEQYHELVQECWRICKPGGYVELLEMDMRVYYTRPCTGKVMQLFNSEVIHAMENKSLDPRLARQLNSVVGVLSQPGDPYRMLYHGNYKSLPLGVWGGRLGVMFRDDVRSLFERFRSIVAEKQQQQHQQQQDEYSLEAQDVKHDHHTPDSVLEQLDADMDSQRAFMNLHYTYAQKVDFMLRSLTLLARRSYTTASNAPSYFVARTSNNGIPVYTDFKNGGTQQLTIIRRIEGDAEALKNEIVALFPDAPNNFARVNPVNNHIILKGIHMNEIKEWLIQKGF
ncbi:hypothetical protein K492DRAFT_240693 [Lichtheimia hyalospora FSU 10163]|nr:hypothetical protein K492DRAFT_240693 [Lichtheimia hyalospora FSU 10163]